ncbi:hypothetical protein [Lysinibacillus capsici]|uniref:hypothetical protein n=1 Tax=Lysinibacillus capsici TaxID=2115968 RepID=UPI0034E4EDEB
MGLSELTIKLEHDTFENDKSLIQYIDKLEKDGVEITSKGSSLIFIKELTEKYLVIINKKRIEFRFTAHYREKKERINEILQTVGPLKSLRKVELLALIDLFCEDKNFNALFKKLPINVEVEFLGFKIKENEDVYHVSLTNMIENGKRKCIIKNLIGDISYQDLLNYEIKELETKIERVEKQIYAVVNKEV